MPAVLRDYAPVTAQRLKNPEDSNWLSIRRTYDGGGYSPLDQITAANVKNLRPVWIFSTGETKVHESAPLVNNGVMFISTPNNQVIALDVRTGNLLWRYKRPRPTGAIVAHDTSRGVALYGDKVYFAAGEAVLVALDARTGTRLWNFQTGAGHRGSAVTYSIAGRQYIATPTGWGSIAGAAHKGLWPNAPAPRPGSALMVFALPEVRP